MGIYDVECIDGFVRMCTDGWKRGWHERNGGNLSYRMSESDVVQCHQDFTLVGSGDHEWHGMGVRAPELAGAYLAVTAAGSLFRDMRREPSRSMGIVQLDETGERYRAVWGFEGGARPTSELAAHVASHGHALVRDAGSRVVYHAHAPNVIALSTLVAPDARTWSRIVWRGMTEYVLFFPDGVGVVPWMVAGGSQIAQATAQLVERHEAVVWTQHGIVVSAADYGGAFGMAEMLEKAAGMYLTARAANGGAEPPYPVSESQLRETCAAFGVEPREEYL